MAEQRRELDRKPCDQREQHRQASEYDDDAGPMRTDRQGRQAATEERPAVGLLHRLRESTERADRPQAEVHRLQPARQRVIDDHTPALERPQHRLALAVRDEVDQVVLLHACVHNAVHTDKAQTAHRIAHRHRGVNERFCAEVRHTVRKSGAVFKPVPAQAGIEDHRWQRQLPAPAATGRGSH